MHPHRPFGFVLLAMCAGGFGLLMATLLGGTDLEPLAIRAAMMATGALALVTAEALLFVRPWALGASLAFAGAYAAMLLVYSAAHDTVGGGVGMIIFSSAFVLPALGYVRKRSLQLRRPLPPRYGPLPPFAP